MEPNLDVIAKWDKFFNNLSKDEKKKLQDHLKSKVLVSTEEHHHHSHDEKREERKSSDIIIFIIGELRKRVPVDGQAPGEKINIPKTEEYEGYTKVNTVHVDGFMYGSEDDVEELCEKGLLAREFCLDCGSQKTEPINYISHSATLLQLEFIFSEGVLGDLTGKVVVDLGSRLGAVLYVAYYQSKASQIIGIEKNKYFADLQTEMTTKTLKLSDRIKIMNDDILNCKETLESADVLVMNNVFEFFVGAGKPGKALIRTLWNFIHSLNLKKGCKLVTIPELTGSWKSMNVPLKLDGWVKEVALTYPPTPDSSEEEDYRMIHVYEKI